MDLNKVLDLIPSQWKCIDESERIYPPGSPRIAFREGAEYVRNYFFNKLNNKQMKTMNINGHELLRLKLKEMGIDTTPQVLEVILALADYIDDHDDYSPEAVNNIMMKISKKYDPQPTPTTDETTT